MFDLKVHLSMRSVSNRFCYLIKTVFFFFFYWKFVQNPLIKKHPTTHLDVRFCFRFIFPTVKHFHRSVSDLIRDPYIYIRTIFRNTHDKDSAIKVTSFNSSITRRRKMVAGRGKLYFNRYTLTRNPLSSTIVAFNFISFYFQLYATRKKKKRLERYIHHNVTSNARYLRFPSVRSELIISRPRYSSRFLLNRARR